MKAKHIVGIVLLVIVGLMLIKWQRQSVNSQSGAILTPVQRFIHSHGLAVDAADPNKLYIATHQGLFLLMNETELFQVGKSNDDFMGFSAHPTDSKVLFSSGHPVSGGNIGFQKSVDGGLNWKKVSNGIGGPVDFHAMAVSPANPELIYGWYQGKIQRSLNGGKSWEAFPVTFVATSLVAHPKEQNIVYAVNPQGQGILVSTDQGVTWNTLARELQGMIVNVLAIHPEKPERLLVYSEKLGLAESNDRGATWQGLDTTFDGEPVYIAFAKPQPNIVYLLTHNHAVYKSTDTGKTWQKIR